MLKLDLLNISNLSSFYGILIQFCVSKVRTDQGHEFKLGFTTCWRSEYSPCTWCDFWSI